MNPLGPLGKKADELPFSDITGKDTLYIEIDGLKKKRDELIEEVLDSISAGSLCRSEGNG